MKQYRLIGAIVGVVALSGCVKPLEVMQDPVAAARMPGFSSERIARTSDVTVRTFTGRDDERVEFAGAACTMQSDEIRASFTTPATIVLPQFRQRAEYANRGRPSELRIVCKANGKTGIQSFTATDKEIHTATNAGIGGAILTAVVSGAIASSTPWRYPAVMAVQVDDVNQ